MLPLVKTKETRKQKRKKDVKKGLSKEQQPRDMEIDIVFKEGSFVEGNCQGRRNHRIDLRRGWGPGIRKALPAAWDIEKKGLN